MPSTTEKRQIWRGQTGMIGTVDVHTLILAAHPGRHRAKWIERLLECSRRTAQRIVAGVGEPSASELLSMARQSHELRAELRRVLGTYDDQTEVAARAGDASVRAEAGDEPRAAPVAGAVGGLGGSHDVGRGT